MEPEDDPEQVEPPTMPIPLYSLVRPRPSTAEEPWPAPGKPWPADEETWLEAQEPGEPEPDDDGDPGEPARRHGGRTRRISLVLARWVPEAWRGARLDPGRAGAAALVLVAAAGAVVAAVGVWSGRPQAEPVPSLPLVEIAGPAAPVPGPAGPTASSAAPAELVVAVVGRVRRPGLVRVPDGSRVADVLEAAGGALPGTDLTQLNLARKVADGEQVAVGVAPAPDANAAGTAAAPGAGAPAAPGGKIDLNRASVDQLDGLPGVGPVTAQRIVEWRTRNGRFSRVDQLREIEGIGERRFAQLRELVTV